LGDAPAIESAPRARFFSATLGAGLAGAVLLWAAFPPIDLPWLAWIAPVPWLWLAGRAQLPGRRPYLALWAAGSIHWLAMLFGICLAHVALIAGWIALSVYLGMYLAVFVGLTRVAVHRFKLSMVIVAPVIWVGLELLRGRLLSGFSMGLLAHTQAEFPRLIQISDLAGGYTLSFLIMLVAACLFRAAGQWPKICWWPLLAGFAAVATTLGYGGWRLAEKPPGADGSTAHVALIQGSLDTVFEVSPKRVRETFAHYGSLTSRAVREHRDLDLVVWPESMFMTPEIMVEEPLKLPSGEAAPNEVRRQLSDAQDEFHELLAGEAGRINAAIDSNRPGALLVVGTTTLVYGAGPPRVYNAALLANRSGEVVNRYFKMHPVMFGEYIPFGDVIPWLYTITPMPAGLSVGDGPKVFEVGGLAMAPSVCFESAVPHLIRWQVLELARRGKPPDVLLNVTNDGWFWGTAILDLHFRCGVFRAVENRKPLLVAANTGISAWIDGNGVIRERGGRRTPQVLFAKAQADGRASPYHTIGDWPPWICGAVCVGLAMAGYFENRRRKSKSV
jgi:apolipoprotein N-acyltransferase